MSRVIIIVFIVLIRLFSVIEANSGSKIILFQVFVSKKQKGFDIISAAMNRRLKINIEA